jgi:hypothetical protein
MYPVHQVDSGLEVTIGDPGIDPEAGGSVLIEGTPS